MQIIKQTNIVQLFSNLEYDSLKVKLTSMFPLFK